MMLGAHERAVAVALECMAHVGLNWSAHPTEAETRGEYERFWAQLGSRSIEDLVDLPLMRDPEAVATLDVLTSLVAPACYTDLNLYALCVCRATNLSLEHGNSDAAPYDYGAMSLIASARFGHYDKGYRLGKMACDLLECRGWKHIGGRTYFAFASLLPWTRPFEDAIDPARRAFQMAAEHGDPAFAALASRGLNSIFLAAGYSLDQVEREAEHELEYVQRFGFFLDRISAPLAFVRMLRGKTKEFGFLDDDRFSERSFEERTTGHSTQGFLECYYWIRKLQARFFAGDYLSAIEAVEKTEAWYVKLPSLSLFMLEEEEYHFYAALSRAACCEPMGSDPYDEHREAIGRHQRRLQSWAANCPQNFEGRAALVSAEIARLDGRPVEAMDLYERAIASARANGFVHHEALACELAGRFYAARGFKEIAHLYLGNARQCYLRWGADGKVQQLDQLHPQLRQHEREPSPSGTIEAPVEQLDLATVLKVSQAVSGEMVLGKLINRLMRAAIEHAGAVRALLIFPHGNDFQIEADATTSGRDINVQLRYGVTADAVAMPETLIRYAARTQESVILDDASSQNLFTADPYINQRHARSILCLPLINQGKLIGILYLENNLTPRVFTPERITVLRVLASQAAISLVNTRLYRDLEDRERKIRRLVDANIIGIFVADMEGRVVEANDAFLRIIGYDREDLNSGRVHWKDLTPQEWDERNELTVAALKSNAVVQPYEKEYIRKDGSRVPVLIGATLFQQGGNEGVAFVLDLSEQKRAEAEIRELKDQLYKENLALRDEVEQTSMFDEIVGTSTPLKAVLSRIAKVAPTDSTVLITGETGTGKELIARAIHKKSLRAGRSFVSVNCAAIPRDLIPSELFGHEKGAFTGATQRRLGRFELADGGTIFLDEVGELLPDTQVALLRVLQERELERVGGGQPIHVDVRVIAATNRDLEAAVADGTFRQDLYYRLNVFPIEVPPLRERKDDLQLLVEYFVQRYGVKAGKDIRSIEKKTLDLLQSYDWPGNIRELQNVIERSVILTSGEVFSVDRLWLSKKSVSPVLPTSPVKTSPRSTDPVAKSQPTEREIIEAALAATRGRISGPSGAAAKLGIPPSTLDNRIKALKISKTQFKFR
jgi:PAS domain S-box-containing protein